MPQVTRDLPPNRAAEAMADAAKAVAHLTQQPESTNPQEVQRNIVRLRANADTDLPALGVVALGFWQDRIGGHVTVQPAWASSQAWLWLASHRHKQLEKRGGARAFPVSIDSPILRQPLIRLTTS